MLKKPQDQGIIWLITNQDTINITTFTGPGQIELEVNRQQIIFLSGILGLKSIRRESQPLLQSDVPTVVIYRNPFKFKHLGPSIIGFARLVGDLPFHSTCRGIDVEKRCQFLQADCCFKNRTLEFPVTLAQVSAEYELVEMAIHKAYRDAHFHRAYFPHESYETSTKALEDEFRKAHGKMREFREAVREYMSDLPIFALARIKDMSQAAILQEALKSAFNLLLILEIYHELAISKADRTLVIAEPHLIEYLKTILVKTGHQEGQTCGDGRSSLVGVDLQVLSDVPFRGQSSRELYNAYVSAASPIISESSELCCATCVLF